MHRIVELQCERDECLPIGSFIQQTSSRKERQMQSFRLGAGIALALQKSQNPQVRSFAEDMVRDHKAVNEQALALVKKLNVTPQDNDTSKALAKQADAKEAELGKLNGAAFDRAYIQNE